MGDVSGPKQRGRGRPWAQGSSGNPAGRPRGSGLAGRLRKAIAAEADDVLAALVTKAKSGDVQAARALLDRVCPTLRPEALPVQVAGLNVGTLTERAQAALAAAGAGEVAVDVAAALVAAIASTVRIAEVDDLMRRIEALEQSAPKGKRP